MLEELVTSKVKRKLLVLFLTNPDRKFYVREMARKTGEQTNAVRRELDKLERLGLVAKERTANLLYYRTDRRCPIYEELKHIIMKTEGIGTVLKQGLEGAEKVRFAFIYGSFASGEERAGSDIDVMVVGGISPEELGPKIRTVERQIGREINQVVFPETEFLKRRREGFIANVMKGKKIMLVGDEDELKRFTG
ncbi:Uncharacterised protein [Candidatus Burarchaeum australiense]|nr:Uncharacterised protein [Candidatus Burarchaeum australiense]